MTELSVLFPGFGQATIAACDGTNLTLCADFPAAPGRPLSGVLETVGKPVSLKVRGSRRLADGRYEIDGRFVSQRSDEDRSIGRTLDIGWELLRGLPRGEIKRIPPAVMEGHWKDDETAG